MLTDVKERLSSLGINLTNEPGTADGTILLFSIDKVSNHIKNQTNLNEIPQGLHEVSVDMVVGEFLLAKKSMGLLNISSLDFDVVAKQVQDGDTNTVFAVSENTTPEAQFNAFIHYLQHNEVDLVKYRVLTW